MSETIGQLYDSLEPGESTHRWLNGERWRLTRLPQPTPMARCEICSDPTDTPPVCARCDADEEAFWKRRSDV